MPDVFIPFSVIVPLYNMEDSVERAIRSVLNQTVQDFEIVVVNDGSTDNGVNIVKAINDPRICLIHQENQGVSAARNCGIAEAKYEWIAFLDADDEWLPEFLETIRRMIEHYPECSLYATRYFLQSPTGERTPAIVRDLPNDFEGLLENYFEIATRSYPPVWTSATCARKTTLTKIGGFPLGVTMGEDILTWARIAVKFNIAYSSSCCSIFYRAKAENDEILPSRVPADEDVVGRGLAMLLHNIGADRKNSLRRYCALWHKMRASCYLRLNMKKKARDEILQALKYDITLKIIIYWIMSFSTRAIIRKVFQTGTSDR